MQLSDYPGAAFLIVDYFDEDRANDPDPPDEADLADPLLLPSTGWYLQIRERGGWDVWSGNALVWDVFNVARDRWGKSWAGHHWGPEHVAKWISYAYPMTRQGTSDVYTAPWPTGLPRGWYDVPLFRQTGPHPAITDINWGDFGRGTGEPLWYPGAPQPASELVYSRTLRAVLLESVIDPDGGPFSGDPDDPFASGPGATVLLG